MSDMGKERLWRVEVRTNPTTKGAPIHPTHGEQWEVTRDNRGHIVRFVDQLSAEKARDMLAKVQPHAVFRAVEVEPRRRRREI